MKFVLPYHGVCVFSLIFINGIKRVYKGVHTCIYWRLSRFSERNSRARGQVTNINECVDECWQRIGVTLSFDHSMIVPGFAIIYARMCPVLVSVGTYKFGEAWELSIIHMGQAMVGKVFHCIWQQRYTIRIVSWVGTIPVEPRGLISHWP